MQLGADADGALLQRALEGQSVDDPGTVALVGVAREVEALEQRGLTPGADFVAGLRQRLLDEPTGADTSLPARRPAVMSIGRRARLLAAAAAVFLVLAGGLGVLSRSALPGDRLYPVKQLLDRVVLELHRDPVGLGRAHLAEAREHVAEAEQLIARSDDGPTSAPGDDRAAELTAALDEATASSTRGAAVLLDASRSAPRADALIPLSDFYTEILPAVDRLGTAPVPPAATAAWQRLHDVLERGRDVALRELASCGSCGDASAAAKALLARDKPTPRAASTTASAPGSATSRTAEPSASPTAGPTPAASPANDGSPGATSTGGRVRLPTVGQQSTSLSAGGGGVTLPGPPATVTLPRVGVNTSGVTVGGGGVTLPGATVSVPTVTVPLPQPPT